MYNICKSIFIIMISKYLRKKYNWKGSVILGLVDRLRNENRERVFKEILGKKYSDIDDFNIAYTTEEEFLLITIKRLVLEKNINDAEDMLFAAIKKEKSLNINVIT